MLYRLPVEILEQLTKKVHLAADELLVLKNERRQLLSELELLRKQASHYQSITRENEQYKRDHDRLRSRLIKMQKKIERLLTMETPGMPSVGGLINNEEHPQ